MSKRGENIRKRKDGRWEARVLKENGKYKSIYADSYNSVKEKLKKAEDERESTEFNRTDKKNISFNNLCEEWLKESQIKNKQSTIARYRGIVQKHLIPYFDNLSANKIEINLVNHFIRLKSYDGKLKASTVNTITAVLTQIIKYGERQGYIENFRYDISKPITAKNELEVLTEKEQKNLVDTMKNKVTSENIGILLSLYTGLRLGEICALQWQDIDVNSETISITKTMQRIPITDKSSNSKTTVIIDAPKSQKSVRKIPIPEFLLSELKDLSKNCAPDSYVLTSSQGSYTEPRSYQYKFKKYLKTAGIRDVNFHALRHTFATRAIEQNIDVKTLSEILGHSTVNFTLDRYVHPSFDLKKLNIEKLAVCY